MAAAYLFHIIQDHPFVDGNKRTGAAAALTFLYMNGVEDDFTEDELVEFALGIAQGIIDKEATAETLRRHLAG